MTDLAQHPSGPLSHIKVVEFGSLIAGPFCGQLLADFGAEVIKIEPPRTGDPMRQWGAVKSAHGDSLWWPVIGRNKKSVTLDLRQPESRPYARALILQADVMIENFRPGTMERWGLCPEDLRREKPELIVARVSGFGQTGPYSGRAGFGSVAEAMSGLRHVTGFADRPPSRVGISIGDSLAGLFGALGILASLVARPVRGDRGQSLDVSIAESVLAVMESIVAEYSVTGISRGRSGSILPGIAPSNLYPTADGDFILIGGNGDGVFARLAGAMGRPELATDPRFATHNARGRNQEEIDGIVAEWTATQSLKSLLALLEEGGVPAGPVHDAAAVCAEPHFRARSSIVEVESEDLGPITMQNVAPKLSETPGSIRWTGPRLGQHTAEILGERLNLSAERIADLAACGII